MTDVVILVGGKGKRLLPFSNILPKPLLPIFCSEIFPLRIPVTVRFLYSFNCIDKLQINLALLFFVSFLLFRIFINLFIAFENPPFRFAHLAE